VKMPRLTTKLLAVLTLGCAAIAAACGLHAGVPSLGRERQPATSDPSSTFEVRTADTAARDRLQALASKLPLYFVENHGQEDAEVGYYVQGRDTAVYFTATGVTFALTDANADRTALDGPRPHVRPVSLAPAPATARRWAVRLDFVDANAVAPRGEDPAPAVVSYWKGGSLPEQSGLKTYRSVVYPELWPGIDLVYTGTGGQLKYTFHVKPGADPDQIRLAYRGATDLGLTDAGQLLISTPVRSFTDDRPYAYQEGSQGRDEVSAAYALAASTDGALGYGFRLGAYDPSRLLVLDPSVLVYAGFIGGSSNEFIGGIAVDAAGNAYVVGTTSSPVPSFPAKVGPDLVLGGGVDAFVAKVKADGSDLVYLGYIGGAQDDLGTAIAVDKAGNAYVTGVTESDQSTFPVKVGPSVIHGGQGDAFVCKVKADGTGLVYCGYIGGAGFDAGAGIAVDAAGNAHVAGSATSDETTFPVKIGPTLTHSGGFDTIDAFVAKIKADGTGLVYLGYIGGAGDDFANAITVDGKGNAYVAGQTNSDQTTFPVTVGPDLNYNLGPSDAFVAKVKPDGTGLVYLGYIGGAGDDGAFGIAVDAAGNAYVAGTTTSDQATFPVKAGPDLTHNGGRDAFVAKVKADGTALVYAGYIGGAGDDGANGIAVDAAGNAYVTGATDSDANTFVEVETLGLNGSADAFAAKVRPDGTGLVWAERLGGSRVDFGIGIAVDAAGNIYIGGQTQTTDGTFPVKVGPDLVHAGGVDGFVAKLSGHPDLAATFLNHDAGPKAPGGSLFVVDFVQNLGLGTAKASTTRYYLSTDTVKSTNDILLTGTHAVPSLDAGGFNNGSVKVTIPIGTPPGFYHVLTCADDTKVVAENDESNNCFAPSFTVQVALPDLAVISLAGQPQSSKAGNKFTMFDGTHNGGAVSASASTTRFYLSKDSSKGPGDVLIGSHTVPALGPSGQASNLFGGSAVVTIPASTTAGTYLVLACADDTNVVKETNETNNCLASTTMQVTK
jgi:CARDB/Beta-propeller repeat